MLPACVVFCLSFVLVSVLGLRYDAAYEGWNLNENRSATDPLDYWGQWENHTFHPSPSNWRFPFYVVTLDRYVDGDPTNNEINGTNFEHDWTSNQFRFGGDAKGLMNNLDYIQGMGIKALYLSGTPFINMPWASDGFGPLDFTLLDAHHGMIEDWRALITEIHRRDMYVILDNTLGTMGDLLQWKGYENVSAPFNWQEYNVGWKTSRQYLDFVPGNDHNASCQYPPMWKATGYPEDDPTVIDAMSHGCKDSEFDQYGDMKGVGEVPVYESQLAKFASVQDRLRTWRSDVLDKVMHFSCLQIAMLDIDGFRMDKAAQTPIDVHATWSEYQRQCAKRFGKENFIIVGEVVSKVPYASLIIGRGKQPDMAWPNFTAAVQATGYNISNKFLRDIGRSALDADAFHYPTYGALTRFLGLDGPIGLEGVDFVELWHDLLIHEDMTNSYTGKFDPRHMFGMTNQDVFRWPSLANGTQRHLLGLFITNLLMPGMPFHLWGEEQESYILENQAADYVFGRTPMSSSRAWQLHGCYKLGEEVYVDMPFDKALRGCEDDTVSLDHRDPSHMMRNIIKRMYELRRQYPVLNDGAHLETLSQRTRNIYLPGSLGMPSPTGVWSVYRGAFEDIQDLSAAGGQGDQGIWLLYHNDNQTTNYTFDCSNSSEGLLAPFPGNTTVKNLFYPYEEYNLTSSNSNLTIEGLETMDGCLASMEMRPWEYKAFVPRDMFVDAAPTITSVVPGHDARLISTVHDGEPQTVPIEIYFSSEMDCDSVVRSFSTRSTTFNGEVSRLNESSVTCQVIEPDHQLYVGQIVSTWVLRGELENVYDGIHIYTISNATTQSTRLFTDAVDHFMFRIGQVDNPVVFPTQANYSSSLLHPGSGAGDYIITHKATGANKWQYSTNWGTSWSEWTDYTSTNTSISSQAWSGAKSQEWAGEHVIIRYWSEMAGSMEHVQHGDLGVDSPPRRWPHMHVTGPWNQYGYDSGLLDDMINTGQGWVFPMMTEYPSEAILSTWGVNPDGHPDKSKVYGDVDGDNVLDWLPPTALGRNVINLTAPSMPYVGLKVVVNDADLRYHFIPTGSAWIQLTLMVLLGILPILSGAIAIYLFVKSFYHVKFNEQGLTEGSTSAQGSFPALKSRANKTLSYFTEKSPALTNPQRQEGFATTDGENRRTVLIASMEYEITDWNMKIKIGGLGVMASLMGKNLQHQNLIWVVPCVGGVEYPVDQRAEPMKIAIMGQQYSIAVQYHRYQNITFILLDAPVFRAQSKNEPYPSRMDDMDSAIYYSAWNQCIAETVRRFPEIDLYHVNDYHGALAPLYLLPNASLPCCLSLHNAEFQGLWSIKRSQDLEEICGVFNLSKEIVTKYVQFGEVFNLLHAGASYLRIHQKGYGAVGVSKKYGKRSFARYPIFWGLPKIGSLPNPDPSDTAAWDKQHPSPDDITIDQQQEVERKVLRTQAQEWAGLKVDPDAELFVFVGRWSVQKGVDIIADVFPSILEKHPKTQLICIGPVIDLHGKFAALKLQKLMELYPDRVCSKPEFTVLPPYIFSGAEFALIPSRDEPFGLVAVEFGRKGALGVGSRVGGLGQMPGWWFTIESVATKHLIRQFQRTITTALSSSTEIRAEMRARSSLQRFPVAQWVEDLEKLQAGAIKMYQKTSSKNLSLATPGTTRIRSAFFSPMPSLPGSAVTSPSTTRPSSRIGSRVGSVVQSRASSPNRDVPKRSEHNRSTSTPQLERQRQKRAMHISTSSGSTTPAIPSPALQLPSEQAMGYNLFPIPSQDHPGPSNPRVQVATPQRTASRAEFTRHLSRSNSAESTLSSSSGTITPSPSELTRTVMSANASELSLSTVVGDQKSYNLQKVDPFFTDSQGIYYKQFETMLGSLNGKTSTNQLCIEEFIVKAEKNWFYRFHEAKLGMKSVTSSRVPSIREGVVLSTATSVEDNNSEEFELGEDYTPPKGLRKFLQCKLGDWPLYSFLLALGQILAANSYQITLLTGEIGQTAEKLYIIASIYLASSIIWWCLFRCFKSVHVIALPFAFYASAFFVLGMAPYGTSISARGWIQNVATGLYSVASGSGSLFFALNFGSEGGTAVRTWVFRACVVQGTQQIYVTVLWYWGSHLASLSNSGQSTSSFASSPVVTAVTTPISILLFAIALVLYLGLPEFYRSSPGKVPSFYISIWRRKIIVWFFVVVVIQNYFLSAPYGRNWRYLWSSNIAPAWSIAILVVAFFILIWAALFGIFSKLSVEHSWILPIFAIGLGAPRWAQMLWGTSGMGLWVPWAGTPLAGALLGRALWLWLGVLDALQGVGFGMILLQTMTRFHVAFTLMAAQVVGSVATIVARATAPDKLGPGDVFPNLALSLGGIERPWFWIALIFQGIVCVGFFMFFRKEQLFKP